MDTNGLRRHRVQCSLEHFGLNLRGIHERQTQHTNTHTHISIRLFIYLPDLINSLTDKAASYDLNDFLLDLLTLPLILILFSLSADTTPSHNREVRARVTV